MTGELTRPGEPAPIRVKNPLDGLPIGAVPVTRPGDVERAVDRARAAFASWGSLSHRRRRPYLRGLTKKVLRDMDRIAATISAETGKHPGDAMAEVTAALTVMDRYSGKAGKLLRPKRGSSWPFLR